MYGTEPIANVPHYAQEQQIPFIIDCAHSKSSNVFAYKRGRLFPLKSKLKKFVDTIEMNSFLFI